MLEDFERLQRILSKDILYKSLLEEYIKVNSRYSSVYKKLSIVALGTLVTIVGAIVVFIVLNIRGILEGTSKEVYLTVLTILPILSLGIIESIQLDFKILVEYKYKKLLEHIKSVSKLNSVEYDDSYLDFLLNLN